MKLLISFAILLLLLLAVPLIIALVYKHFYNHHVNRVFTKEEGTMTGNEEEPSPAMVKRRVRKWISPIAVFFIALAVEIAALVLTSVIYMERFYASEEYQLDSSVNTMTQSDASADYGDFNGSNVANYSMTEQDGTDFTCQIYEKADTQADGPRYVVRFTYTGSQTVRSWDDELYVGTRGISAMGDFDDDSRTLYVAISDDAVSGDGMELLVFLYEGALDDYSTGAMGTYDMPDPAESFTITVR